MTNLTPEQLGVKIKKIRKQKDYSQQDVAGHLGLSRQAISAIEKGKRKIDSIELKKLSELFSVSTDQLLAEKTETNRKKPNIDQPELNKEKLKELILYISEKCGGRPIFGETVLYKMLYFIDFDAYERLGDAVTGVKYKKLQFGPVPNQSDFLEVTTTMEENEEIEVFTQKYHDHTQKRYVAMREADLDVFSENEKKLIDKVIQNLSNKNGSEISNYAHGDVPWKVTKEGEIIDYNLVFDRELPYAASDYLKDFMDAGAKDINDKLEPLSKEEYEYYNNIDEE